MADTTYTTALVLNQITDEFGIPQDDVVFRGGGKGQRASASGFSTADGMLTGKGTTRTLAAQDLLIKIREFYAAIEAAEASDNDGTENTGDLVPMLDDDGEQVGWTDKAPRVTIEDAVGAIRVVFAGLDVFEEDDDRAPGPVWEDQGGMPVLVSITPCVGECMQGRSDVCDCRCMGANHGLMRIGSLGSPTWSEIEALRPVPFGPKPCLCGCGGLTDRKFVPGHDARFHAMQDRIRRASAAGISLEELAEADTQARKERVRARKAERRAARAVPAA